MSPHFIARTLEVLGEILIAYTALRVHLRVWREHKIDGRVFNEMRREQVVGILGILLLVVSYLIGVVLPLAS
ncbi:hypothetical protein HY478_00295 [Candidatus Uhrbacteria bacterium]|nr:hypothetical protein [Candidatus Uhrbacteria bacterium]